MNTRQIKQCLNTISPNTFHMICGDALLRRKGLSVVRMGEGELKLWNCLIQMGDLKEWFSKEWRVRIGVEGIDISELMNRFQTAYLDCDYFSPSISGITNPIFDLYFLRTEQRYLDNFFINFWSEEQIVQLYKTAGHVVLLHRNEGTGFAFNRRANDYLGIKVTYLPLSNWSQSEDIIKQVSAMDAPLVLFSGGPASKYIAPEIAKSGKVVLDVGNSVDRFILFETEQSNKDKPNLNEKYLNNVIRNYQGGN